MDPKKCVQLPSGQKMPLVGLGMWQAEDEDSVRVALEAAIAAGYRHIDTAFAYKNEHFIGNVLKEFFEEGTVRREDLFITSKLPLIGLRQDAVEYFFKKSLNALQLEYLDLYLIHAPLGSKRTEDGNHMFNIKDGVFQVDDSVDLVETWRAMESLVEKGLTKSIGLSNFNSQQIQRIFNAAVIKPANLQVECHAYLPQYELHNFCKKLNISFTAYSPVGSPGYAAYASKQGRNFEQEQRLLDDEKLKPICKKYEKTSAQILLRYLVQRGIIVIPKSTNPKRILENIQVFDFELDQEDMNALKSMGKNHRFFTFNFAKGIVDHPEYPFNIPF